MKRKGLVYKLIITFSSILALILITLALVLSLWFKNYFFRQKIQELDRQSKVISDSVLPSVDGIDVLKWIRREGSTPVIMLTAKGDTFDKVLALELGADDYVVKPFEPKELMARVKAVMRRYSIDSTNKEVLHFSELIVDVNSYKVEYKGGEVKMPPKEFELLYYLASNKNKVFTREQLLCEVWGYDYPGDSRTVDVHVKRLREKLSGGEDWQIETVWGVGYKFEVK